MRARISSAVRTMCVLEYSTILRGVLRIELAVDQGGDGGDDGGCSGRGGGGGVRRAVVVAAVAAAAAAGLYYT